ncbi:hypothetical protein Glove_756g22 [Diversispora epigaea]|uniref:Uncharacterized protein n=1 Tax=Diversispora epigaea TaxID=1348612 RepID=A0A397G2N7_9GLOM|nr:hypothetical protein Glove_756g22 [Diversispora epigaea]
MKIVMGKQPFQIDPEDEITMPPQTFPPHRRISQILSHLLSHSATSYDSQPLNNNSSQQQQYLQRTRSATLSQLQHYRQRIRQQQQQQIHRSASASTKLNCSITNV